MDRQLSSNWHWFYPWLKKLTGRLLASEQTVTLQPTALANDIVVKLMSWGGSLGDNSPDALKRMAAKVASLLLIDRGRKLAAKRRFIDRKTYEQLQEQNAESSETQGNRVLEIMDAVDQLNLIDHQLGQLVILRFFEGLDIDTAAARLGLSRRTAIRRWTFAKAILKERILFREGSLPLPPK
jgi:hypothetical protein